MKLKLKRESLEAMLICQAKNDIRYYLNGIFIGADGTLAATNGHVALISTHDNKIKNDVIISVGKIPTKTYDYVEIDTITEIAKFRQDSGLIMGVTICALIDGGFPDIKRVIPTNKEAVDEIAFSAGYLAMAEKIAKIVTPKWKMIKFELQGSTDSAMAKFKLYDGTEFKYIVMPMRIK